MRQLPPRRNWYRLPLNTGENARQLEARAQLGGVAHDEALAAQLTAANLAETLPGLRAQLLAVRHAQAVLLGRSPDQQQPPLSLAESTTAGRSPCVRADRAAAPAARHPRRRSCDGEPLRDERRVPQQRCCTQA